MEKEDPWEKGERLIQRGAENAHTFIPTSELRARKQEDLLAERTKKKNVLDEKREKSTSLSGVQDS